jgi:hypothetical protein
MRDRSVTHSRVLTEQPRSDQNRAIESHDDNVSEHKRSQSRKETEFSELIGGYFVEA